MLGNPFPIPTPLESNSTRPIPALRNQLLGEAIYKEAQEGGGTKDEDSLDEMDDDDLLADFDLDDDTFSDLDDE